MATRERLIRKSFFVDVTAIRKAKKALGVETASEAIRTAVERTIEIEEFWRFMDKNRKVLKPGSIGVP